MKIIEESATIYDKIDTSAVMTKLEEAGRVCYKSEMGHNTADAFVWQLIAKGHESVLEHVSVTVKFVVDRGMSHEIVRHRLASYSQESTRYCNYSKDRFNNEITVIKPCFWGENSVMYKSWEEACLRAETQYFRLLEDGASPQEARSVLPNSLKTELFMTANLREWRHFFRMRTAPNAHPHLRKVVLSLYKQFCDVLPVVFEDIAFTDVMPVVKCKNCSSYNHCMVDFAIYPDDYCSYGKGGTNS